MRINDISLRNKLVLMQVFTSVLVLSVFFFVYIESDLRVYKQRKLHDMISLARIISTNSLPALQFHDTDAARNMLRELKTVSPEIEYAALTDSSQHIFAELPQHRNSDVVSILGNREYLYNDSSLLVSDKIDDGHKTAGKVILQVSMAQLEDITRSKYQMGLLLLLFALLFSFLVAVVVQAYISRRLFRLVNSMREVSKTGDYSKTIEDEGKDEISMLINVFNRLMDQVKESQQRKDEFIGIASHELKTPLTSLKGYVELLKRNENAEPGQGLAQKAYAGVLKLERLVKDLLDVSNIQSGHPRLQPEKTDLGKLLAETIASFSIVSKSHNIIFHHYNGPTPVCIDRQRIEQVFINLLANAIKYSPGEQKILVYVKDEDNKITVQVRDFGIGIPPDEREQIFERFYRSVDASTSISGFGLGLYISKSIIERHNGNIWVEPEDKGTSFYFSLPKETTVVSKPAAAVA